MTVFVLGALALAALTVVLLVVPLAWQRKSARGATQSEASVAVLKDQLADLERELASGAIGREAYEAAQNELKSRLLEDTAPEPAPSQHPSLAPPLAIAILLPVCAIGLYLWLGSPEALVPQAQRAAGTPDAGTPDAAQIEGMVERLAKKMESSPDDPQGWLMLARSYRVLGRNAEAARAYSKAEGAVAGDPKLLTDYAEALALVHDSSLEGKPTELLERALKLDPEHTPARLLLGAAYFQRGDWAGAIGEWEKARTQVPPGSEDARVLEDSIARAREHSKGMAAKPQPGAERPAK